MAIPRLDFREGTEILVPPEVKGPQVHIFPKAEPKSMDDMVMTSEGGRGPRRILGKDGTQFESKTVWQNGKTERIDVENPAPGERPGQIHYHEANNTKWYLDIQKKQFYNPKTGELAPKKIQKLLNNKDIINAINKALKFLGEDKIK